MLPVVQAVLRTLDNTNTIANVIGNYGQFERSYDTINKYYRALAAASPRVKASSNTEYPDRSACAKLTRDGLYLIT